MAYKRGSLVRSLNPVLHWEMATMEGTSNRARMERRISLERIAFSLRQLKKTSWPVGHKLSQNVC